jgi:hypothetical protein
MDQEVDLSKAPIADVVTALSTDPGKGLAVEEAQARLAKDGANALVEKTTSQWPCSSASSGARSHG